MKPPPGLQTTKPPLETNADILMDLRHREVEALERLAESRMQDIVDFYG
jgi:hypothetical protein